MGGGLLVMVLVEMGLGFWELLLDRLEEFGMWFVCWFICLFCFQSVERMLGNQCVLGWEVNLFIVGCDVGEYEFGGRSDLECYVYVL